MLLIYAGILTVPLDEFKAFEPWRADTHLLALKMFRHLESVKGLCRTYADMPPGHPPSYYIDFSSAQIVTRAAIETFLNFAYVFAQEDLTLSKFRSEMWRLIRPFVPASVLQVHRHAFWCFGM